MKLLPVSLGLAVVAICLGCSRCRACDPLPSVASVLAKWEEASQKVKTLDAKLTVWRYDQVFGDGQPTITQGPFYYEAPNLGRYEIRENAKGAANDWSSVSEAIIWTGKETLWIEGDMRRCRKLSTAELQSMSSELEEKDFGWWPVFARAFVRRFQGPNQLLPFLIGIPASEVRERFNVTIEESGEEIRLGALPKRSAEAGCYLPG